MNERAFDLDRNIWALAATVFRRNWQPFVLAAGLLLAASVGQGYLQVQLPFIVARALILMIAGYAAYRTLLTAGRVRGCLT